MDTSSKVNRTSKGINELNSTRQLTDRQKEEELIGKDDREKAFERLKNRIGVKPNSPLVVCVIGSPGSGKSSFINTMISGITGEYREWARFGSYGGYGMQVTRRLSIKSKKKYLKYVKTDKIEEYNFPTFMDLAGFEDSDDIVTRVLLELVFYGRLPPKTNLAKVANEIRECGTVYVKRKYPLLETSRKIDRIFFVASSTTNTLPKKLMKAVLNVVSTKRDIPIFGVITNKDRMKKESKEAIEDFKHLLGLSRNRFFLCTNYCDDNLDDITNGKTLHYPYIDVPVLNFLCQALDPAIKCTERENNEKIDAEKEFFKLFTTICDEIEKRIGFQKFYIAVAAIVVVAFGVFFMVF